MQPPQSTCSRHCLSRDMLFAFYHKVSLLCCRVTSQTFSDAQQPFSVQGSLKENKAIPTKINKNIMHPSRSLFLCHSSFSRSLCRTGFPTYGSYLHRLNSVITSAHFIFLNYKREGCRDRLASGQTNFGLMGCLCLGSQ